MIAGSGSFTLGSLSTATLILSGSNTYTGGTLISGGTLQLGDGSAANGSLVGNITNNASLAFGNPLPQNFSPNYQRHRQRDQVGLRHARPQRHQ